MALLEDACSHDYDPFERQMLRKCATLERTGPPVTTVRQCASGPATTWLVPRGNALWLISHECLHVKQQRETGWGRFLIAYAWEWLHHGGGSRNKFESPAYSLGYQVYQAFMKGLQGRDSK